MKNELKYSWRSFQPQPQQMVQFSVEVEPWFAVAFALAATALLVISLFN